MQGIVRISWLVFEQIGLMLMALLMLESGNDNVGLLMKSSVVPSMH